MDYRSIKCSTTALCSNIEAKQNPPVSRQCCIYYKTMCASSIFTRSSVRIATLPQTSTAKISWKQLQSYHHLLTTHPNLSNSEWFWNLLCVWGRVISTTIFFHDLLSAGRHVLNMTIVRLAMPFLLPNISFQGLLRRAPSTLNDRTILKNSYYSVNPIGLIFHLVQCKTGVNAHHFKHRRCQF